VISTFQILHVLILTFLSSRFDVFVIARFWDSASKLADRFEQKWRIALDDIGSRVVLGTFANEPTEIASVSGPLLHHSTGGGAVSDDSVRWMNPRHPAIAGEPRPSPESIVLTTLSGCIKTLVPLIQQEFEFLRSLQNEMTRLAGTKTLFRKLTCHSLPR
jgi:hypothetical protein